MTAVGIDLGTTNSAAAVGGKDLRVLPTRGGEQLTPSVVSYYRSKTQQGEIVVGRQAVANAARDPENTIFSIKRLMGRLYGEPWRVYDRVIDVAEVRRHAGYRIAEAPTPDAEDQGVKVHLGGQTYSPADVSAMILKQVKADAEQALGQPVTHAVVTVPAYFTERQRVATRQAGEKAGLTVLRVLDEPTAAALAFGAGREDEKHRVLVFDLGGGTFDISIIQMRGGQYNCLEIQGDNWLGGDDFDQTIVARLIECVRNEYGVDPADDRVFLAKAKEEAERAKKALSTMASVDVRLPLLRLAGVPGVVDLETTIRREEFQEAIQPLVARTMELVQQALRNQSLTPDQITEVLMVGGSTAVPLVQDAVAAVFGRDKVRRHVNPMECVALGAAVLAATYDVRPEGPQQPLRPGPRLWQRTALNLGIAAVEGDNPDAFAVIIPKGTPYPLQQPITRVFRPTKDNQAVLRAPVFEGLNDLASLNEQQGVVEFHLPHGVAADTPVEISFNYDENRALTVEIRVAGLSHRETLRHGRAPVKPGNTLVEDWRERLSSGVRMGRYFLEVYEEFVEEADRRQLEEAVARGKEALQREQEAEGVRALNVLRDKLFDCGVASMLWLADRVAARGASAEDTEMLQRVAASLRVAYKAGNRAEAGVLSRDLRTQIAKVRAKLERVEGVRDKPDFRDILQVEGGGR